MYLNETTNIASVLKPAGWLIFVELMVFGLNNSANAANANVNFSGFVMPRGGETSVSHSQTLVSFTDQVLLPVPANTDGANGLSVYSGSAGVPVDFQILDIQSSNTIESSAILVSLDNSSQQEFYLCRNATGGCVRYTVIRTN